MDRKFVYTVGIEGMRDFLRNATKIEDVKENLSDGTITIPVEIYQKAPDSIKKYIDSMRMVSSSVADDMQKDLKSTQLEEQLKVARKEQEYIASLQADIQSGAYKSKTEGFTSKINGYIDSKTPFASVKNELREMANYVDTMYQNVDDSAFEKIADDFYNAMNKIDVMSHVDLSMGIENLGMESERSASKVASLENQLKELNGNVKPSDSLIGDTKDDVEKVENVKRTIVDAKEEASRTVIISIDGSHEEVLDVVNDYERLNQLLDELAQKFKTPVFHAGMLGDSYKKADSLGYLLGDHYYDSIGTGLYASQRYLGSQGVEQWLKENRNIYAFDMADYTSNMLHINSEEELNTLQDALTSMHAYVLHSVVPTETEYVGLLKARSGIDYDKASNPVQQLYEKFRDFFSGLGVSLEDLSDFLQSEHDRIATLIPSNIIDFNDLKEDSELAQQLLGHNTTPTNFVHQLLKKNGIDTSALIYGDDTTIGSVIHDDQASLRPRINFGQNKEIARLFYSKVFKGKVLTPKAFNIHNRDDDINDLIDSFVTENISNAPTRDELHNVVADIRTRRGSEQNTKTAEVQKELSAATDETNKKLKEQQQLLGENNIKKENHLIEEQNRASDTIDETNQKLKEQARLEEEAGEATGQSSASGGALDFITNLNKTLNEKKQEALESSGLSVEETIENEKRLMEAAKDTNNAINEQASLAIEPISDQADDYNKVSEAINEAVNSNNKYIESAKEIKAAAQNSAASMTEESSSFSDVSTAALTATANKDDFVLSNKRTNDSAKESADSGLSAESAALQEVGESAKQASAQKDGFVSSNESLNGSSGITPPPSKDPVRIEITPITDHFIEDIQEAVTGKKININVSGTETKSKPVTKSTPVDGLLSASKNLGTILSSSKFTQSFKDDVQSLQDQIDQLAKSIGNVDVVSPEQQQAMEKLLGSYDELIAKSKTKAVVPVDPTSISKLDKQMADFAAKNPRITREFTERLRAMREELKQIDNIDAFKNLIARFNQLAAEVSDKRLNGGTTWGQNLANRIKQMSTNFIGMYFSLYDIVRYAKQIVSIVTEVDSALIELQKVSDASNSRIQQSFQASADTARELGATITSVINSTSDWARMGYSVDDAEQLAKMTQLLQNVGDNMSQEDASQTLVSTIQGFQLDADDALLVIDKYNEVANNFAIDTAGIGAALQRSAASFNAANTDLSKAIALVTTANTVVQNPESVGTTFKTLSARIRGASTELSELGEEEDEFTKTTSKLRDLVKGLTGFDIMENEDTYKDIYDIILGIGREWQNLTDIERASLGEALAGKRNANVLYSVLDNIDTLQSAYATAENAAGSAEKEQEHYAQSIEYSLNRAKAALQELAYDFMNSDLLKGLIDGATKVLEVIDKIVDKLGGLSIPLAGVLFTGVQGLLTGGGPMAGIVKAIANSVTGGMADEKSMIKNFGLIFGGKKMQDAAARGAVQVGTRFNQQLGDTIEDGGGTVASGLKAMLTNPATWILAGITAIAIAKQAYDAYWDGINQRAHEAYEEYSNTVEDLATKTQSLSELRTKLDAGGLSDAETLDLKKQIYAIQQDIVGEYGNQAAGIDLVNGDLQTQLDLLRQIQQENARASYRDSRDDYEKAISKTTKPVGIEVSGFYGQYEAVQSIMDDIGDLTIGAANIDGSYGIMYTGNLLDAENKLNEFYDAIESRRDEFISKGLMTEGGIDELLGDISKAKQFISDEYGETIESAFAGIELKAAAEGYPIIDNYRTAVSKLNEALLIGDVTQINEAKKAYDDAMNAREEFIATTFDGNQYYDIPFQQYEKQINTTALKQFDFKQKLADAMTVDPSVITDSMGVAYAKQVQKYADAIKESGMDAIDIEDVIRFPDDHDTSLATTGIISLAHSYGILDEEGQIVQGELEGFISILRELGIIAGDTASSIATETVEAGQKMVTTLSSVMTAITNAKATGKSLSYDTFASEDMSQFAEALEYRNGTYSYNIEKLQQLARETAETSAIGVENNKIAAQEEYIANMQKINQLRAELGANADDNIEIQSLLEKNAALVKQCDEYDLLAANIREAAGEYQTWLTMQNAPTSGDMLSDSINAFKAISDTWTESSETYGKTGEGNTAYQAALDFVVPENIQEQGTEAVKAYYDSIAWAFQKGEDGTYTELNPLGFLDKAVEEGLMEKVGDDYNIIGRKTMEDFAEGMGLALPLVQAIFGELDMYENSFEWEDNKTFGDLMMEANEAREALRGIEKYGDMSIQIDVSKFEKTDDAVSALKRTIKEMQKITLDPNVDPTELEYAESIITYAVAQMQELQYPAVLTVDTSQLTGAQAEAMQALATVQQLKNAADLEYSLHGNTTEYQEQLAAANEALQGLQQYSGQYAELGINVDTTNLTAFTESLNAVPDEVRTTLGVRIQGEDQINRFNAEAAKADTTKTTTLRTVDLSTPVLKNVLNYLERIKSMSNTKISVTTTETKTTKTDNSEGGVKLQGTAHAWGNARTKGDWGMQSTQRVLIGELGPEIVVNPHTGRWRTYGDNGPEFAKIPKDAIVFNHKQSEELLRRGFVNSRGTAMASGNAFAGSVAGGISGVTVSAATKKAYDDAANANASIVAAANATKDAADQFSEKLDEIEIKINRIERAIEKSTAIVDSSFNKFDTRINTIGRKLNETTATGLIKQLEEEINIQARGEQRYLSEARAVNLSSVTYNGRPGAELARRIREGEIDIESITDEDVKKKADEYKQWYEKALDCHDAIDKLKEKERELYQQRFELTQSHWEDILGYHQAAIDYAEEQLALGAFTYGNMAFDKNNRIAGAWGQQYTTEIQKYNKLISESRKETAALETEFKRAVKEGNIAEGSEAWYNMKEAIEESRKATVSYRKERGEVFKTRFDDVASNYERQTEYISTWVDLMKDYVGLQEESGRLVSRQYYDEALKAQTAQTNKLMEERKRLVRQLLDAEANGIKKNSATWYEMVGQINEVDAAIVQSKQSVEELNNSIDDLRWTKFEFAHSLVTGVREELEFLYGLMDQEKFFDENGYVTDQGIAGFGTQALIYENQIKEAQRYAKQIAFIEAEMVKDPNNTDLIEKWQELKSGQQDAIQSAYSSREAIKSLVKDGIDKQVSALNELIDKYTELMDTEREQIEYQRNIEEQQENINALRKQMSSWAGDTSEEGAARRQQVANELRKAERDLADAQEERRIAETKKMLSDLAENYEEVLNRRLDDIDALIKAVIDGVNDNGDIVRGQLKELIADTGYIASAYLVNTDGKNGLTGNRQLGILDSTGQLLSNVQNGLLKGDSSILGVLNDISKHVNNMEANSNAVAKSNINAEKKKTASAAGGFASGTKRVKRSDLYWTNEGAPETIIRKSDGAILTKLDMGDTVLNNAAHENLWGLVNNPMEFLQKHVVPDINMFSTGGGNNVTMQFNLSGLKNPEEFMSALQKNKEFEQLVQELTFGRGLGHNSLAKNAIMF